MDWFANVDWSLVAQSTTAVVAAAFALGKAIGALVRAFGRKG